MTHHILQATFYSVDSHLYVSNVNDMDFVHTWKNIILFPTHKIKIRIRELYVYDYMHI
jgi:hypothetical protein